MKHRVVKALYVALALSGSGVLLSGGAWAHDGRVYGVAPPAVYPAKTWQGRSEAVVRVLDRLDAHVTELTIPVGQEASYRSVSIRAMACLQRPPTLPADAAVHLHIEEMKAQDVPVFDGWMLANAPALGVYGNPLYDVQLVRCQGQEVAPHAGALPKTQAPSLGVIESSHVDADQGTATGPMAPPSQNSGGGPMSLLPPTPSAPSGDNNTPPPSPAAPSANGLPPGVP